MSAPELAQALVDSLDDRALDRLAELLAPRLAELGQRDGDEWLDAKGAADHLGLSRHALHRLSQARERTGLPVHQDVEGGKLWFLKSELDAWRAGGGA